MIFTDVQRNRLVGGVIAFLAVLSVYFVVKLINEVRAGEYIGTKDTPSTITVSGDGEVFAAPDIAAINFTARGEASTVKVAQSKEAEIVNKALAFLKEQGIEEKDIKTSAYYTTPKYDNGIVCYSVGCPSRNPKIIGYEASQTVEIKVRDIEKVGDLLTGLGTVGVTEISGPNFTIENEDVVRDDARELAIDEAREKAEKLARSLGVDIVRVTNFQESVGGFPIYGYAKDALAEQASSAGNAAPDVPTGENKISVNVTITYEIR